MLIWTTCNHSGYYISLTGCRTNNVILPQKQLHLSVILLSCRKVCVMLCSIYLQILNSCLVVRYFLLLLWLWFFLIPSSSMSRMEGLSSSWGSLRTLTSSPALPPTSQLLSRLWVQFEPQPVCWWSLVSLLSLDAAFSVCTKTLLSVILLDSAEMHVTKASPYFNSCLSFIQLCKLLFFLPRCLCIILVLDPFHSYAVHFSSGSFICNL